jgi:hypothetical protein
MVKTFDGNTIDSIPRSNLAIGAGELSGDLVSGGTIKNFSSTGIKDLATVQTLIIEDNKVTVKSLAVGSIESNFTVRGDVKIYGVLDAGFVRTTELITNQRYEKQYLEFAHGEKGTNIGTGLLWPTEGYNKQFVLMAGPDRFFSTESLELASGRNLMIGGSVVVSETELGSAIKSSKLTAVGRLEKLSVLGDVDFNDNVFYNAETGRFSIGYATPTAIFTVYDEHNDIEVVLNGNRSGYGQVGTRNTKGFEVITDDQARISVNEKGDITFGHEYKDSTLIRAYGKLSVGVKNPREQFEVAGNMRFGGKLFATADEPPTSGNYTTGDVVWNSKPRPTGHIGWVCVAGGSPGMWKTFGQISG